MKPEAPKKKDTKPSAKSGDKACESKGGINDLYFITIDTDNWFETYNKTLEMWYKIK